MFILKRFKIMKNSKVARRKENGGQIWLKNGFLEPKRKKTKDEKIKEMKLFEKNRIWKIICKLEFRKIIFKN